MYKENIVFNDYNGKERAEDFYFDLSQAELIELEMTTPGGFTAMLDRAVKAEDHPTLFKVFKDFIKLSYGEKSPDGREFEKSDRITARFMQTRAYSNLMVKLCTDADYASKFINGIIGPTQSNN